MGLEDIQFWVQQRYGERTAEIKGNTFNKRWSQEGKKLQESVWLEDDVPKG